MSEEIVQANFRMPKSLKDKIEKAASTNNRSITSELVLRLEQSFNTDTDAMVLVSKQEFDIMNQEIKALIAQVIQAQRKIDTAN